MIWVHNVLSRSQRSTHIPEVGDLFEVRPLTAQEQAEAHPYYQRPIGLYVYLGWYDPWKQNAAIETYESKEARRNASWSWTHRVWNVHENREERWGASQFEDGYYLISRLGDSLEDPEDEGNQE